MNEGSDSPPSHQHLLRSFYKNSSHPSKCEVLLICGFDLHSPAVKWFWASFHVLIESSNSYLGIATKILVTVPKTSIRLPVNKNLSLVTKHPSELSSQFRAGFYKQPWGPPWTQTCAAGHMKPTTTSPQINRRVMKQCWDLILRRWNKMYMHRYKYMYTYGWFMLTLAENNKIQ